MADDAVIRLFSFRAVMPAFDEILRHELMPELCTKPGLVDCYSGRQGPDGSRLVASVWRDQAAMVDALGLEPGGPFHPEYMDATTDRAVAALGLRISERFPVAEAPRILRILRGRVKPGELDAYVEDVRHGTAHDADSPNGPTSLYLGVDADGSFATVSAWRDWHHIELATGGDIHRPRATRRPERLLDWDVDHYEIVESA
jgi:hypothetical protein